MIGVSITPALHYSPHPLSGEKNAMSSSIFNDKSNKPDSKTLQEALGETYLFWEEIKKHIAATYGEVVEEWKFYNQKSGWIMKVLLKKEICSFLFL